MEPKLLTAQRFVDPETGCSYRYVYSETERFRPHWHEYYEVFLMLEGNVTHKVNGGAFPLSRGSLVLIRPKDCHDYVVQGNRPVSFVNITFSAETVEEILAYLGAGFPGKTLLEAPYPPQIQLSEYEFERFNRKMQHIRALDPGDSRHRKTMLRMLLFDIFTRHFSELDEAQERMPLWLEEMCAAVRNKGGFVQGMAYFLSLTDRSREHVSRCMKKYMGMTPSEYINSLRLNYIANMLRDSNCDITEIIFESGFNNISWASEQFKKKYGMTMRQYRKQIRH